MRNLILSLLSLALLACGQNSQLKTKIEKTTVAIEKTSIEFKEKSHNFGHLNSGEIVIYTFEFTNTGNSTYFIQSIHSDCGCVKPNFKSTAVKPGENGRIEVEFDTAGLVGNEYKTIEIRGNSKELKHLAIFAEVKNELFDIKY